MGQFLHLIFITLILLDYLMYANLISVKLYFIVILICLSQMTTVW